METVGALSFNREKVLGHGRPGTNVFSGFYEKSKKVAIKRILRRTFKDDEIMGNREVKLMEKAGKHPYILRFICTEIDRDFM